MRKTLITATLLGAFFLASCKTRIVDYTIISTKNLDLSRMNEMKRKASGANNRVVGKDVSHSILIFRVTKKASVEEAIDKAIEAIPGAVALVDGVVYSRRIGIPFLYGQRAIFVEGTPLIDHSLTQNSDESISNYTIVELSEEGEIYKKTPITKNEYQNLKAKANI